MTYQQARELLKSKYPGKMFLMECSCWTCDGVHRAPRFGCTVYLEPDSNGWKSVSGQGGTLEEAVNKTLVKGSSTPEADAAEMFADPVSCVG